ncbi:MAG: DUF1360 domain-containing protein [Actinomycetota bacterium]|nr:DUF1360 domain-containing protein [Actinomycetota bacterium]
MHPVESRLPPAAIDDGETPVDRSTSADYAELEAVFLTGLAGVIVLARRRQRAGAAALAPKDLPALALATFALADMVAKEKVSTWLRQPFVSETEDHRPIAPRGHGLRRAADVHEMCWHLERVAADWVEHDTAHCGPRYH